MSQSACRSYTVASGSPDLTRFYREQLKPGMTFIDVGANIGYFTVLASRLVGPEGRVIGFKPNPRTAA